MATTVDIPSMDLAKRESRISLLRRNSTGSLGLEIGRDKVLPHYLRTSFGSCHDNCKYGTRSDEFDQEKVRPAATLRRFSTAPPSRILGVVTGAKTLEGKKIPINVNKPSSGLRNHNRKHLAPAKEVVATTTRKVSVSAKPEKIINKPCDKGNKASPEEVNQSRRRYNHAGSTRGVANPNSSSEGITTEMGTNKDNAHSKVAAKTNLNPPNVLAFPKASRKVATYPNAKSRTSNDNIIPKKAPKARNNQNNLKSSRTLDHQSVPEKTIYVIEPPILGGTKEVSPPSQVSASSSKPPEAEDLKEVHGELDSSNLPSSPASKRGISVRSHQGAAGIVRDKVNTSSTVRNMIKARNFGKVQSADSDQQSLPEKLKFRRGKVIDVQTEETSPKMLRFSQGKEMDTPDDVEMDEKRVTTDGMQVLSLCNELDEKKETTISLNIVIEKTASKLAQAKKSKVMALVGAFETVFSLQDTKR